MSLKAVRAERQAREFSLTRLIDRAYKANKTRDPRELADIILPKIPAKEYKGIVAAVLPTIVRQRVGALRRAEQRRQRNGGKGRTTRSKVVEITAALNDSGALFAAGVHVNGGWMQLGDMTADDALTKANEYREQAAPLMTYADAFSNLGRAVLHAQADIVRELDEDAVRDIFSGIIEELFEDAA
jgi:hypothetical protein